MRLELKLSVSTLKYTNLKGSEEYFICYQLQKSLVVTVKVIICQSSFVMTMVLLLSATLLMFQHYKIACTFFVPVFKAQ